MSFLNWIWKKVFGSFLSILSFLAGILGFFFLIIGSGDGNGEFFACGCGLLILMVFLSIYGRYQKAHIPVIQQAPQQVIVQQVPQARQMPMQTMPRQMPPVQPMPPPLPPPPIPKPLPKQEDDDDWSSRPEPIETPMTHPRVSGLAKDLFHNYITSKLWTT